MDSRESRSPGVDLQGGCSFVGPDILPMGRALVFVGGCTVARSSGGFSGLISPIGGFTREAMALQAAEAWVKRIFVNLGAA